MLISATHTHSAPVGDGLPRQPAPTPTTPSSSRPDRRGDRRAGRAEPRARAGRLGGRRRLRAHPLPALDPPARPDAHRPLRRRQRPGQHAPRLPEPRRRRALRPGRSRAVVAPVQTPTAGRSPLLANYSMHYFGTRAVSADYFGRFAEQSPRKLGAEPSGSAVRRHDVAGHQRRPACGWTTRSPTDGSPIRRLCRRAGARRARRPTRQIEYHDWVPLAMAETDADPAPSRARRRAPRLGTTIVAELEGRPPRTSPEVYAREALYLHERARTRAEAPGAPHRRPRHRRDPRRGLRPHRPEAQGPEPAAAHVQHRAGQRRRGLHPAPRTARAGRLHHLARPHRRPRGPGRAEDRRGRA